MSLAGSLQHGEVHIWQMSLDNAVWDMFAAILSDDERDRAARFRTPQLQHNFSRCRSALRLILSLYANQSAGEVKFRYDQFGKPELLDHRLHFNVTHSDEYALIAISMHAVGIDLELTGKSDIDLPGMIDMVCHPEEKALLTPLPEAEKLPLFYRMWTQKEAYCKALGVGLQQSLPAVHFRATADPAVFQVCLESENHGSKGESQAVQYYVHTLNLFDGYAASVCLPLADARIGMFSA